MMTLKLVALDNFNLTPATAASVQNLTLNSLDSEMQDRLTVFNYYKINAVKVILQPVTNSFGTTAPISDDSIGGKMPPVYVLWEPNEEREYTAADVAGHPNSKMYSPFRRITMYRKIKPTFSVTMGLRTGVAINMRKNFKISTTDLAAVYGRILYTTNSTVASGNPVDWSYLNQQFIRRTIFYVTVYKLL